MWRTGPLAAVVAVLQFVTAWAVLGAIGSGYDPLGQTISELAATGAPTRPVMTASLVAFGVLMAPFAWTFLGALPGARVAAMAILVNALGSIGVGAFPCSEGCPGTEGGISDLAHTIAATVSYVGLALAPLATARHLRRRGQRPRLRAASSALGWLTLLLLAAWVLGIGPDAPGLLQRAATTAGDAWFVVMALAILVSDGELITTPHAGSLPGYVSRV